PVIGEPEGAHDSRESAVNAARVPAIYAGRLAHRGEVDYYSFRADAGQTFTFEVNSGLPQIAAGGSAETVPNFDPALTIYEPAGSWFDSRRLNRIAYNDEPVWVFGKGTDAYLVHRFPKAGEYVLRIEAFAGQGGPDYSYALKIVPGMVPQDPQGGGGGGWDERGWMRRLDAARMSELQTRGGKGGKQTAIETYRTDVEPVAFKIPATLEGNLKHAGEIHRGRFHLETPADIAIEIETPAAAPPYFNPIFRLLDPAGEEVASNIFAGKGACSGAMTKAMQSKTILPLRDIGEYTIEIRDATADLGGEDFQYRVQIRPQIPHVGQIGLDADTVNLPQGEAKLIHVTFDREEDYRGAVTVAADSLPAGVSAVAATDFLEDKDSPPAVGKRERYVPRTERIVVALTADSTAPLTSEPREIRLSVRPLVDGKSGAVLWTRKLPMMVVAKP